MLKLTLELDEERPAASSDIPTGGYRFKVETDKDGCPGTLVITTNETGQPTFIFTAKDGVEEALLGVGVVLR